jgi:hypothetical protein
MPINLNRREVATVIAGLHLLAGDAVRVPNYPRTLLATLAPDAQTEYELRYEADEDYVRELIERINEIAARGAQLCRRCTRSIPASGRANREAHSAATAAGPSGVISSSRNRQRGSCRCASHLGVGRRSQKIGDRISNRRSGRKCGESLDGAKAACHYSKGQH